MIIYGWKATPVGHEDLGAKCSHCGTMMSVQVFVYQKYAHIFWIPAFPLGKTGGSVCTHCKQTLKPKEMPNDLKLSYDSLRSRAKTPIWTFSGLIVIGLIVTFGIFAARQSAAANAKMILAPQAGDVYEVKEAPGSYTLYKVARVAGDSVYVLHNLYETNKSSGLADLMKKEFSPEEEAFTKNELKELFDKGTIDDIRR
ncbi:zinc-ribbon domain-containing protein [Chitinophaga sp. GCM10012297]|uniref:Zinc-ribbon domain-containing protein n=1 Tax=Chitinophaga chungangae TaxID=2821488 RepID=A0ABS3Y836_9BACT|nr:zinc-ribbon domain-containing protein [Chitinophaga chungangae]MBO9150839.1 zinc-ribbon domain-containing protein [Chitinophaga chungangae]